MKFIKSEISNAHRNPKIYVFCCNLDEIHILICLLKKSKFLLPKCKLTEQINHRIHSMIKSFNFSFYADEKFGNKFEYKDEK